MVTDENIKSITKDEHADFPLGSSGDATLQLDAWLSTPSTTRSGSTVPAGINDPGTEDRPAAYPPRKSPPEIPTCV